MESYSYSPLREHRSPLAVVPVGDFWRSHVACCFTPSAEAGARVGVTGLVTRLLRFEIRSRPTLGGCCARYWHGSPMEFGTELPQSRVPGSLLHMSSHFEECNGRATPRSPAGT